MKKIAKLYTFSLLIIGLSLNFQSCQEKELTPKEVINALPVVKVKISKASISETPKKYKFSAKRNILRNRVEN